MTLSPKVQITICLITKEMLFKILVKLENLDHRTKEEEQDLLYMKQRIQKLDEHLKWC